MCADMHCPDGEYLARLRPERLDVSDAYAASGCSACVRTQNFFPDTANFDEDELFDLFDYHFDYDSTIYSRDFLDLY